MLTYTKLQGNRRQFLALTGLTLPEFQLLLTAFTRSYERLYLPDRTLVGRPRQRFPGGGRKGVLYRPEQKLLFMLVDLKTYPLQALMGEFFGLSQPRVNYWIHRLLPVLREALDEVGVLPERTPVPLPRVNRPPERDLGSSSMARNGGAKGRKTLKNRPRTTAGRRKPTATRTWSSWMLKVNVLGS